MALARALIMRPKVLLLDEPLSALDKNLRETMQLELRRLQKSIGITFVMVTHDQYEAMTMSDRIGVMLDGKLVQVAKPEDLYARPCNRDVAGFIGGMNFFEGQLIKQSEQILDIDVNGLGSIKAEVNTNVLERGVSQLVGVRPEQLEISSEILKGADICVQGVVANAAFYGESVHYFVNVPDINTLIVVSVPNYFHTVDYKEGDTVWLGLQHASVIDLGTG